MKEKPSTLNQRLAVRISELRAARALSMDALAEKSGVSRSMISVIERGESNATAVVLDKLAASLGVSLASLFEEPAGTDDLPDPLSRRQQQALWQDPASGYWRRNLSPPGMQQSLQLTEVEFPAGATVAFESSPRAKHFEQQVWLLEGVMQITVGSQCHELHPGDCLAKTLANTVLFHNPGKKAARYLVAQASPASEHS